MMTAGCHQTVTMNYIEVGMVFAAVEVGLMILALLFACLAAAFWLLWAISSGLYRRLSRLYRVAALFTGIAVLFIAAAEVWVLVAPDVLP